MKKIYIFGYGSLMSFEGRRKTLPNKKNCHRAILKNWSRIFNKPGKKDSKGVFLFLNIIPNPKRSTCGALVPVNRKELELLKEREYGYEIQEITDQIVNPPADCLILAFVAPAKPNLKNRKLRIKKSYITKCTADMTFQQKGGWIKNTDFNNTEIYNDLPQ